MEEDRLVTTTAWLQVVPGKRVIVDLVPEDDNTVWARVTYYAPAKPQRRPPPDGPSCPQAAVTAWLREASRTEAYEALCLAKVCTQWEFYDAMGESLGGGDAMSAEYRHEIASATLQTLDGGSVIHLVEKRRGLDDYRTVLTHPVAAALRAAEDQAMADGYRIPWRE